MRATMGFVRRIAGELLGEGTYSAFTADAIPHGEANDMFVRR